MDGASGAVDIRRLNTDGTLAFVTTTGSGYVNGDGSVARFAAATLTVESITIDPLSGYMYLADGANNLIRKITDIDDVFSISPALPASFTFNTQTGAITGTPSVIQAATTYTVTSTNSTNQSCRTTLSIAVTSAIVGPTVTVISPCNGSSPNASIKAIESVYSGNNYRYAIDATATSSSTGFGANGSHADTW